MNTIECKLKTALYEQPYVLIELDYYFENAGKLENISNMTLLTAHDYGMQYNPMWTTKEGASTEYDRYGFNYFIRSVT